MLRTRLLPASIALAFAACSQPDSALRVAVTVDDTTPFATDCLRVSVLGADGAALADGVATFVEPANKKAVVVVRKQSGWPDSVTVRVEGLVGPAFPSDLTADARPAAEQARCAAAANLRLNAQVDQANQAFPQSGLNDVTLTLKRTSADTDGDNDGFASVVAGTATRADCNDVLNTTHYGQTQLCTTNADTDCNDLPGCDDPVCFTIGLCATPPTKLVLIDGGVAGGLMADGSLPVQQSYAYVPLVYELQRSNGAPQPAIRDTPVTVSAPGFQLLEPSSGSSPALHDGGFVIPVNQQRLVFFVASTEPQLATLPVRLDAEVNKDPAATGTVTVTTQLSLEPTPVAALRFVSPSVSSLMVSDTVCTPGALTLELLDGSNRRTLASTGGTAVAMELDGGAEGGPSGPLLFADSNCASPVGATTTVPQGAGQLTVTARDTHANDYEVRARLGSNPGALALTSLSVTADVPTRVSFSPQPLTVTTASQCDVATVTLRDRFNNASPARAPLTLALAPSRSGLATGNSNDCGALSSLALPVGTKAAAFGVDATTSGPGAITVTPSDPGIAPGTLTVSVDPGPPTNVALSGPAVTATANACSTDALLLTVYDAQGNATRAQAGGVTVSLEEQGGSGTDLGFSSNGACSGAAGSVFIPEDAGSAQVFFKGTLARSAFTVGISGATPLTPSGSPVPGNSIVAATPSRLAWTGADAGTTIAGDCTPADYRLTLTDDYANPTTLGTPLTINVTSAPTGGVQVTTTPPTNRGPSVLLAGNQQSVNFAACGQVTNTYALSANGGPYSTSSTVGFTVTPSQAHLELRPADGGSTVTAGNCHAMVLAQRDTFGNPAPAGGTAFPITWAPGSAQLDVFANDCSGGTVSAVTMSGANVNFSVRPKTKGALTVSAAADASVQLSVLPAALDHLVFDGGSPALQAGVCSSALQVEAQDVFNNPLDTGSFTLKSSLANSVLSSTPGCGGGTPALTLGPSGTVYFTGFTAGAGQVFTDAGSGAFPFAITANSASRVVLDGGARSASAGSCAGPVLATFTDAFGNPTTAGPLTVTLGYDGGRPTGSLSTIFAPSACGVAASSINVSANSPGFSFLLQSTLATNALDLTVSAGLDGGDVHQGWSIVAKPPDHADWADAGALDLPRYQCVPAGDLVLRDEYGNDATGTFTVNPASSVTSLGIEYYGNVACAGAAVTSFSFNSTDHAKPVFIGAAGSGSGTLTLPSPSTTPARPVSVSGPLGQLSLSAPNTPAFAEPGACLDFTVGRGLASFGVTSFTVTAADPALTLHTDAACATTAVSSVSGFINNGRLDSLTHVYVHAKSVPTSAAFNVLVTDDYGGADGGTYALTLYPLVRTGTVSFSSGDATVSNALSPALPGDASRSFLLFSTQGHAGDVRCFLDGGVQCDRLNTSGSAVVSYQVVSFGRGVADGGVSVRQLTGQVTAVDNTVSLGATVDAGGSFVLFSSSNGATPETSAYATAKLVGNGQQVRLQTVDGGVLSYAVQVVSVAGAQVSRGELTLNTGATSAMVTAPAGNPFLLYSARVLGDAGTVCSENVRGALLGGNFVFTRGAGDAGCTDTTLAIAWEGVTLPGAVGSFDAGLESTNAATVAFTPPMALETHRAVVFMGGQGPGGQSTGETASGFGSAGRGRLSDLDAGTVLLSRPSGTPTGDLSWWTPWVLQFDP